MPTTAAPTTEATQPTEETLPAAAEYSNPLTGEKLEEPYTDRPVAITINNVDPAYPHHGLNDVDVYFEMLVNDNATRGLAIYAIPENAPVVGSVRSARYNFVDVCQAYNAVLAHAGGSDEVMSEVHSRIDNLDAMIGEGSYFYRDSTRQSQGYAFEHTLFTTGKMLVEFAQAQGLDMTQAPGTDYGLHFAPDGTPDGEDANVVVLSFWGKTTRMTYDPETNRYLNREYGEDMIDGNTGEREGFTNVFAIQTDVSNYGVYHVADLLGSGDGYYASGGKIVPIQWHHEKAEDPFTFTLLDGTPLVQTIGSSYVGIVPMSSQVTWE